MWILALALLCSLVPASAPLNDRIAAFADSLEGLAQSHHLPGLSAALVMDGEVAWSAGFGYADLEGKVRARPDTPYRLASLSKPLAATVLALLAERGDLDLDARMDTFAVHPWFEPGGGSWAHYPERYRVSPITVRHVLSHTSQSTPPGSAYRYSGNIFADLTWVIEDVTRTSYPRVLQEMLFDPVGMNNSSPGHLAPWKQGVVSRLAAPYALNEGVPSPGTYPGFGLDPEANVAPWRLDPAYRAPRETTTSRKRLLGDAFTPLYSLQTAAGVISTVEDLARFDIALDGNELISPETRDAMFTPARTPDGEKLPYGLGWFAEEIDGAKVVWHYGWHPPTVSGLYIKLPEQGVTLILLSNCDGLSAGVPWTEAGVRGSPFGRLFLRAFASE